ncbi:MAG: hypothetical protein ACK5IJ_05020 [Mangrovibacterium sp.]
MKRINILILLSSILFFNACSNRNDLDDIVANEFEKCPEQSNNCVVDFSKIMKFEWDTMYYFSGANSLEDIKKELGFSYNQWEDIGDRVIFLNKGKIVYQKYWFSNPSEELKGVVFATDLKTFKVDKSNAKFKIREQGKAFYLEKL